MKRILFFMFVILFFEVALYGHAIGADAPVAPTIISIEPTAAYTGGKMRITGTNLNDETAVKFKYYVVDPLCTGAADACLLSKKMLIDKSSVTFKKSIVTNDTLEIEIPIDVPANDELEVAVIIFNGDKESTGFKTKIKKGLNIVDEAILLMGTSMPASAITEQLYHNGRQKLQAGNASENQVFGNVELSAAETKRLKEAHFEDDFIQKMTGQPQYITLGAGALWLNKTSNFVVAPMLRIFINPTGYFSPRKVWYNPIDSQKWGINLGYTPTTSTIKGSSSSATESKNYALLGVSYEINRSALFNVGYAKVPGGTVLGKDHLWYFGFTVDQNFLKALGLMNN